MLHLHSPGYILVSECIIETGFNDQGLCRERRARYKRTSTYELCLIKRLLDLLRAVGNKSHTLAARMSSDLTAGFETSICQLLDSSQAALFQVDAPFPRLGFHIHASLVSRLVKRNRAGPLQRPCDTAAIWL